MTKEIAPSLLAAILFCLSLIRVVFNPHLQMWVMQWWIAGLWMIWKFKKTRKFKYFYISTLLVSIQFWEALLPVYWFIFGSIFILGKDIVIIFKNRLHVLSNLAIASIFIFPVANVYLQVSAIHGFSRTIRDAAHFGMSIERLWESFFSSALYFLFFASVPLFFYLVKRKKEVLWVLYYFIFSFLMTFGPVLKWMNSTVKVFGKIPIPLPYAIFYYIVPGFSALRTPVRWILPTALLASILVAVVLSKLKRRKRVFYGLLALIILLGSARINVSTKLKINGEIPEIYKATGLLANDVVLELPTFSWLDGEDFKQEMYRQYYSLYHRKKTPDGISGFYPKDWITLRKEIEDSFPSKSTTAKLKEWGVDYVIVHKDLYDEKKLERINLWGINKLIWENKLSQIYKIN